MKVAVTTLVGFFAINVVAQPRVAWTFLQPSHIEYETILQAMDDADNLCLAAATSRSDTADVVTMKIDPRGQLLWRKEFGGPTSLWDGPTAIAADRAGNVCVTTATAFTPFDRDILTLKYDPVGNLLWSASYAGPALRDDFAAAIATDATGAVYLVGTENANGDPRAIAIKYDSGGRQVWKQEYAQTYSFGEVLSIADDGSVYCGAYLGFFYDDPLIVKLDAGGRQVWAVRWRAGGSVYDLALNNGNLYALLRGAQDVVKFDSNGNVLWQVEGPGYPDFAKIGFDQKGNVFVGAISRGEDEAFFIVQKHDRNGRQRYRTEFQGAFTWGRGFAVDGKGNAYLTTGRFRDDGFRSDALVKLDPRGNQVWQWGLAEHLGVNADMITVSVDRADAVLVSGPLASVKLVEKPWR